MVRYIWRVAERWRMYEICIPRTISPGRPIGHVL